jgi:hypothetical protein
MSEDNEIPVLSKEATAEILGDKLSFIIAFGVNGEVVQYLPHGADVGSDFIPLIGTTDTLTISLDTAYPSTSGFAPMPLMSTRKNSYWCFKGGQWVKCNTPC